MMIVLVAAVADNGVIGRGNALPFRQSSDLKRFKALTWNRPVLMGRKTFASIGRVLPGRTNIVVTRERGFSQPGVVAAPDIETGLALARADASRRGVDEIMAIGGSDIFTYALPLAGRLEITHVHARPEGDVFFPTIEPAVWREVARSRHERAAGDDAPYSYVTYLREPAASA